VTGLRKMYQNWHQKLPGRSLHYVRILTSFTMVLTGECCGAGKQSNPAKVEGYESDKDPGYSYIERLQKAAGEQIHFLTGWETNKDNRRGIKDMMERSFSEETNVHGVKKPRITKDMVENANAILSKKPPTRYEDPVAYYSLTSTAAEVTNITKMLGWEVPRDVRLGTLSIPSLDASTVVDPKSGAKILTVNRRLFEGRWLLTELLLSTVTVSNVDNGFLSYDFSEAAFRRVLESRPEVKKRFIEIALYLFNRWPKREYMDSGSHLVLSVPLMTAMDLFCVGHEYGHIIGHHNDEKREPLRIIGKGGSDVEVSAESVARSWLDEFEADFRGFVIMEVGVNKMPRVPYRAFVKRAPFLYFRYKWLAEQLDYLFREGRPEPAPSEEVRNEAFKMYRKVEESVSTNHVSPKFPKVIAKYATHPPAYIRRMVVERTYTNHVMSSKSPEDEKAIRCSEALERNLGILLEETGYELLRISQEQNKRSPK